MLESFQRISPTGMMVTIIQFSQTTLTAANAYVVKEKLGEILTNPQPLLIDLSHLILVDSMGISVLVSALRSCRSHQQPLKLAGLQESVKMIFSITQLDALFSIYDTLEAALADFSFSP
ncbi:MAG: STAS domain-containing protein [Cyanobacteriota bacterium]|nr:STAS domain-containing protein [Cyanobacteriota bacterium]